MKKGQKITVFSVIVGVIIVLLIIAGIMLTKNKE